MKTRNIFLIPFLLLTGISCGFSQDGPDFETFGAPIETGEALDADAAASLFGSLQANDTIASVFRARVLDVCQAKGCWMRLELPEGREVMVRFKDYGFFVPMDIAGRQVAVEGRAFISEVPEVERRHLARDAGASETEVKAITGPLREPGFEALGVRVYH